LYYPIVFCREFADKIVTELTSKYGEPIIKNDGGHLAWDTTATQIVMWKAPSMGDVKLFYTSQEYAKERGKDKQKPDSDKL